MFTSKKCPWPSAYANSDERKANPSLSPFEGRIHPRTRKPLRTRHALATSKGIRAITQPSPDWRGCSTAVNDLILDGLIGFRAVPVCRSSGSSSRKKDAIRPSLRNFGQLRNTSDPTTRSNVYEAGHCNRDPATECSFPNHFRQAVLPVTPTISRKVQLPTSMLLSSSQ